MIFLLLLRRETILLQLRYLFQLITERSPRLDRLVRMGRQKLLVNKDEQHYNKILKDILKGLTEHCISVTNAL